MVGVVSYLLVNFWFTRGAANRAAMMALLTNRVGDWGYILGLLVAVSVFLSLDTATLFGLAPFVNENILTAITIALTIGVMGKSAQLGLHAWLPHAMEGFQNRALLKLHYMREHPLIIKSTIAFLWNFGFICYFGKILICGQSAGNEKSAGINKLNILPCRLGSSETLREDLNVFNYEQKDFISWFIGFLEGALGDGCLHITNKGYLEAKITQSSTDAQVLFYIKKNLGFGQVKLQDSVNKTHCYVVRDSKNLYKLISILNGNMRTISKQKSLAEFINAYNLKYKQNILIEKSIKAVSLNDGWLSGFTDAEGCFTCSVIKRKASAYVQVTIRYILSQKGEIELLSNIALLLKGKISYQKSYEGERSYNMVVNYKALPNVLTYFKKYPLKTKKNVSLTRFIAIYNLHKNTPLLNKDKAYYEKIEKMSKLVNKNI